jgi:large repetitive protein
VSGVLNGAAWHDANFDDVQGGDERALAGWSVDLYRDDRLLFTALTGYGRRLSHQRSRAERRDRQAYELRFRAPGAGARTALLGRAASPFTNSLQRITDIVVPSGGNLQGLNLPIDPNGVVYNAVTRAPIAGAHADAA